MPRKPNTSCNMCGAPAWSTTNNYRCHGCRRASPQPYGVRPMATPPRRGDVDETAFIAVGGRRKYGRHAKCETCGAGFVSLFRHEAGKWARYCSIGCSRPARAIPNEWTERTRRKAREAAAPGLRRRAMRDLVAKWRRSGVACAYCPGSCETIDHVVPLSRGGTNYEGNLVPCCKRCNSSKSDLLLIEWRLGKPHGRTICHRPWMSPEFVSTGRRAKSTPPTPLELILDASCAVCGSVFTPKSASHATCSHECSAEWAARAARNAYRRKAGKPEDWITPTKPWGGRRDQAIRDGDPRGRVRRPTDRAA